MSDSHPPPLVVGPGPMALLAFHRVPLETRFDDAPVQYALVALWHRGRLLLVRERSRQCWELPGGGIEPGESPREAAVRELYEETGQVAAGGADGAGLRFVGFTKTRLGTRRRVLYGALFTGETAEPCAFAPTEEISGLCWWDVGGPLPDDSPLQTVDRYLAAFCRPDQ